MFYVNPGKTVTISGLTITNGHPHGVLQRGGGIHNDQAALTVTNCTLSGNSGDFGGGGIYNDSGAVTVTNCTLSGNSTSGYQGGGIFNDAGAVTVTNCMLQRQLCLARGWHL